MRALVATVSMAVLIAPACSSPRRDLDPVTLPTLDRVDTGVQTQIRQRYETLTHAMAQPSTPAAELAAAYGEYGMVLQAAEFLDAA